MATANDTFIEASTVTLPNHTSDSGHTWTDREGLADLSVDGATDVCYANTVAGVDGHYISAVPASADYSVQATFKVGNSAHVTPGISGRNATGANTMYWVNFNEGTWYLRKWVAGTVTQIGTYTGDVPTAGLVVKLEMLGNQISVYVSGVLRIGPITDTSITAAGRGGIASYYADATAARSLDNWSTIEAAGGRTTKNLNPWPLGMNIGAHIGMPGSSA